MQANEFENRYSSRCPDSGLNLLSLFGKKIEAELGARNEEG